MRFYIWSYEHDAWWGPESRGYTKDKKEAGIYSAAEAVEICYMANRFLPDGVLNEKMVNVEEEA